LNGVKSAKRKLMFELDALWHMSFPDRSGKAMKMLNNQLINIIIIIE